VTKHVLVGVDQSETAARAASTAAELAAALDAHLHVMTAYGKFEVERYDAGGEEILFSTEQDGLSVAEEAVRRLRAQFPDVRITPHTGEGKPGPALVALAGRLDVVLIVVGNKRVQGLARVLGSVARDVVTTAPCDVYVAHTH
jgi:nucleotide-binding universal stress UspA family protein